MERKVLRMSHPSTSTIPDNIQQVRQMLADDRGLSLRMAAEELGQDSVNTVIHEYLKKHKIYTWFVLHKLTGEQKQKQMVWRFPRYV